MQIIKYEIYALIFESDLDHAIDDRTGQYLTSGFISIKMTKCFSLQLHQAESAAPFVARDEPP